MTIDLTTADHDNAIKPFLHLVGTTHYDPDIGEKNPDAGVFKVDSVVVEHYKDGDEVVAYRCKYNDKGYNTKKKRILSLAWHVVYNYVIM